MKDLISIIVPVYNVEKYLNKCIESIIKQTYKNIEIILIDDGSTDNCGKICDEYKKIDNRIKVIHKENEGVSSARNIGIQNSNGNYIGFVDSDDYIEKDMYEKLVNEMKLDKDLSIAICGVNDISEEGIILNNSKYNKEIILDRETFFIEILNEENINAVIWNKLFKKELFSNVKFNEQTKIAEDLELFLNIIDRINKVKIIPNKLYNWLVRKNSVTKTKFNDNWKQEINICKKVINVAKKYRNIESWAIKRYMRINISCYNKILKFDKKNKQEKKYIRNNIKKYIFKYLCSKNVKLISKFKAILICANIL